MVSFVLKPIVQSIGDELRSSGKVVAGLSRIEYLVFGSKWVPLTGNPAGGATYSTAATGASDLTVAPAGLASFAFSASGNDNLIAVPQNGLVQGTSGPDLLRGGPGPDQLNGAGGNDILLGFGDVDLLDGGTQDDSLYGDSGNDGLSGGDGNDRAFGWTGNDTLNGGIGNDRLAGEDGNDTVNGDDGDDVLFGDRDTAPLAHSGQEIIDLNEARIGAGDFAILYQGPTYTYEGLRASDHDLIIINPARFIQPETVNSEQLWSAAQVNGIEATGKRLIGYLSVSKINDFVDYWDPAWTVTGDAEGAPGPNAPAFLGADDPDYNHTRLTNYWAAGWKELLAERVETIVAQGFSGLFLDDVLAYFSRRGSSFADIAQAAREMRDLIIYLADVAWDAALARDGTAAAAANFTLIVNGAPFLISDTTADGSAYDAAKAASYYASIDAFLAENYFSGFNKVGIDKAVAEFGSRGIALLSVDTGITSDNYRILIERAAIDAGFLPEVVSTTAYGTDTARFRADFGDTPAPGTDVLNGGPGNDILDGGGGADTMRGGPGNDFYFVDHAGDAVVELAAEGADTIATDISYGLSANVENLQARNIGGTAALALTGNGLSNYIWGTQGNNVIDGGGGVDFMIGYAGNDVYHVDHAGDLTYEDVSGGADTVVASVSYRLGANIENLQALDIAGTAALALTGNGQANFIWGTQGNNIIDGAGGADFMIGYGGDDIYHVDNVSDIAYELDGGGSDTAVASISYTLAANIENLQALNIGGTAALALTGNELRNYIWATQGNNIIDGGAGADVMIGYGGNDVYYVDNAGDVTFEEAGGGEDTVAALASYALGANIENLQAANIGGTAALSLTGNEQGNFIWGTQGNNVIAGRGGNDRIFGYGGADQFLFNTAAGNANFDWLDDFQAGVDKIVLDNSVFTALADGALPASAFVTGTSAADANDRIIFDAATGSIFYDADGNGAGSALLVAVIPVGQALTAADFQVV